MVSEIVTSPAYLAQFNSPQPKMPKGFPWGMPYNFMPEVYQPVVEPMIQPVVSFPQPEMTTVQPVI